MPLNCLHAVGVVLALVRTRCGLLKCLAQRAVHEMFASVGAKCTPGGTCSDLDGGPYRRCRPPRRARKFVNESGRTRKAEARYKLSQDGEAVLDLRPGRRRARPAGARVTPLSARRDGAAVMADCSSLKGKLSVWLGL